MKIDFTYTDVSVKDRVSEIEKLISRFAESFNIQEKENITVPPLSVEFSVAPLRTNK